MAAIARKARSHRQGAIESERPLAAIARKARSHKQGTIESVGAALGRDRAQGALPQARRDRSHTHRLSTGFEIVRI